MGSVYASFVIFESLRGPSAPPIGSSYLGINPRTIITHLRYATFHKHLPFMGSVYASFVIFESLTLPWMPPAGIRVSRWDCHRQCR